MLDSYARAKRKLKIIPCPSSPSMPTRVAAQSAAALHSLPGSEDTHSAGKHPSDQGQERATRCSSKPERHKDELGRARFARARCCAGTAAGKAGGSRGEAARRVLARCSLKHCILGVLT
jgi:hypothetical protein